MLNDKCYNSIVSLICLQNPTQVLQFRKNSHGHLNDRVTQGFPLGSGPSKNLWEVIDAPEHNLINDFFPSNSPISPIQLERVLERIAIILLCIDHKSKEFY